jgi:two-component system response regulator RegX3
MSARILIIDDDDPWRLSLMDTLQREGFEVVAVPTATEALSIVQSTIFDLLILDVRLPDKDGYDVCLEIRKRPVYVPIIMVSGVKKELVDREIGLRLGADYYFEKPTDPREIVAQVRALLRMTSALKTTSESDGWLEVDQQLRINFRRRQVMLGEKLVELSPQEFELLGYLVKHAGTPCTRDDIVDNVWGAASGEEVSDAAINTMIARLRQKIEPDPHTPRYILTVHRWGYKFRSL